MISKLPEYSSFVKYKENDLCIYNGILYKALVDDSTNLPTVSSDWKPLIIGNTSITAIGLVSFFAASIVPSGWLECNGSAISRTQYTELFSVIGTTFGEGDGSTTFNLPDLRGEFIRGWDNSKGVDTDREFGSSQIDALQNITGSITTRNSQFTGGTGAFTAIATATPYLSSDGTTLTGSTQVSFSAANSARTAEETRPRNIALLPCIKYQADISQSISNPNILINTNGKNPINQRGVSEALSGAVYGFDRWTHTNACTQSATGSGLRFAFTAAYENTSWGAIQRVENFALYSNKTLTLSGKVRASGGDLGYFVIGGSSSILAQQTFAADGEWHEVSITYTAGTITTNLYSCIGLSNCSAGGYVEFEWIKLEEGTVATPWLIPDPQIELARCQRYYQRLGFAPSSLMVWGYTLAGNNIGINVQFPQMRTTPTATWIGTWQMSNTGSANFYISDNHSGELYCVATASGVVILNTNATSGITLDAEI